MDERDTFAVWVAGAILQSRDLEFEAEALAATAQKSKTSQELDAALREEVGKAPRPGDFGVEFLGPLIPLVLVSFGRALWDAYVDRLAEQGGKALADLTVARVKDLVRRTWSGEGTISLDIAEERLREAARAAGLDDARTNHLVAGLRSPEAKRELVESHT